MSDTKDLKETELKKVRMISTKRPAIALPLTPARPLEPKPPVISVTPPRPK